MAKSVPAVVIQAFENHTVCSDMSDQNVKFLKAVQRHAAKLVPCLRNVIQHWNQLPRNVVETKCCSCITTSGFTRCLHFTAVLFACSYKISKCGKTTYNV